MQNTAVSDEVINAALALENLDLPEIPRIVDVHWRHYIDPFDEESLRVWMILADDTTDAELKNGLPIAREVMDKLIDAGVDLFPYVGFGRLSELKEIGAVS